MIRLNGGVIGRLETNLPSTNILGPLVPKIKSILEMLCAIFLNLGHLTWIEKPWDKIFKEHLSMGHFILRFMDFRTFFRDVSFWDVPSPCRLNYLGCAMCQMRGFGFILTNQTTLGLSLLVFIYFSIDCRVQARSLISRHFNFL
jgi:hypothetical protein